MPGSLFEIAVNLAVPVGAAWFVWARLQRRRDTRRDRARALARELGLRCSAEVLGVKAGEEPGDAERELRSRPGGRALLRGMIRLAPMADSWVIDGEVDGVAVEIRPAEGPGLVGSGGSMRLAAAVTPALGMDLHVGRASAVDRLAWVSGMQRVPSGSTEFDQRISCHAADVGALRRLLQRPGLLPAVHELFADENAGVHVQDDQVVVTITGPLDDVARVRQHLRRMAVAARRLSA